LNFVYFVYYHQFALKIHLIKLQNRKKERDWNLKREEFSAIIDAKQHTHTKTKHPLL
jgi:hypothetical protein